jgi:hypothetical protein
MPDKFRIICDPPLFITFNKWELCTPHPGKAVSSFRNLIKEIRYVGQKYAQNGLRLPSRGSGGQVKFGDLSAVQTKSAING